MALSTKLGRVGTLFKYAVPFSPSLIILEYPVACDAHGSQHSCLLLVLETLIKHFQLRCYLKQGWTLKEASQFCLKSLTLQIEVNPFLKDWAGSVELWEQLDQKGKPLSESKIIFGS